MKINIEVSLDKVQQDAEALYLSGFSCSESVVCSIRDCFELDIPREVIALSSGFSGGIGKSGCVCGALAGGVMALGIFFGRTEPGDTSVVRNHELSKDLHDYFKVASGKNAVCCRVLTRGFDLSTGEHKSQCVKFVGVVARKVAQMVLTEYSLTQNK